MGTRYTCLREAIARLASPAEIQADWLDYIFSDLTKGTSAADYGNDELLIEFDDFYIACGHMFECGEIKQHEIDAARTLDDLLERLAIPKDKLFWERLALFNDPRWVQIRECAAKVLKEFPDEIRESEWTRRHGGGAGSKAIPSSGR